MRSAVVRLGAGLAAFAFVACAVLAALSGCAPHAQSTDKGYSLLNKGKLVVGVSLDEPLFEYYSGSTPEGYGVAVAQEVASRLGLECVIKDVDAASSDEAIPLLLERLENGEPYDIAVSSIPITSENASQADFTRSYYEADQAIVVKKDACDSRKQLSDQSVAALSGSESESWAKENVSDNVVGQSDVSACKGALEADSVQAIVLDAHAAESLVASSEGALELLERDITAVRYGIAVNKLDEGLADAIDEILDEMEQDGTLAALQDRYLK